MVVQPNLHKSAQLFWREGVEDSPVEKHNLDPSTLSKTDHSNSRKYNVEFYEFCEARELHATLESNNGKASREKPPGGFAGGANNPQAPLIQRPAGSYGQLPSRGVGAGASFRRRASPNWMIDLDVQHPPASF